MQISSATVLSEVISHDWEGDESEARAGAKIDAEGEVKADAESDIEDDTKSDVGGDVEADAEGDVSATDASRGGLRRTASMRVMVFRVSWPAR